MAGVKVASVRGIPIILHWTFLLALPVFAWLMASFYFGEQGELSTYAWLWGSLLAIGLFGSVLLHEMAHSLMALREGVSIRHITLLPIGGVSAFEETPRDPGAEFRITVVGPLTNLVIGLPLLAWWYVGIPDAVPLLSTFVLRLAQVNLIVGAFNLFLPAFPMDGGRILRSLLARPLGRLRATRVAAMVGRGLAIAMGVFGFFVGAWLLVLIAVFVYMGARQEEAATRLTAVLSRFRVEDVMTRPVDTLDPMASVREAFERMLETKHVAFPVLEGERPVGVVHLDDIQAVPGEARGTTPVRAVMRTEFSTLHPADEAEDVGKLLTGQGTPTLVVDDAGSLVGIVTATDVMRVARIVEARRGQRGQAQA